MSWGTCVSTVPGHGGGRGVQGCVIDDLLYFQAQARR